MQASILRARLAERWPAWRNWRGRKRYYERLASAGRLCLFMCCLWALERWRRLGILCFCGFVLSSKFISVMTCVPCSDTRYTFRHFVCSQDFGLYLLTGLFRKQHGSFSHMMFKLDSVWLFRITTDLLYCRQRICPLLIFGVLTGSDVGAARLKCFILAAVKVSGFRRLWVYGLRSCRNIFILSRHMLTVSICA